MKHVVVAALVAAQALAAGAPASADEITVAYETFTAEATLRLSKFPCPEGCVGSGTIVVTSPNGGPSVSDNVTVSGTDALGCAAGSLSVRAASVTYGTEFVATLTRAGVALAGQATYAQTGSPTRTYPAVAGVLVPATVDPARWRWRAPPVRRCAT